MTRPPAAPTGLTPRRHRASPRLLVALTALLAALACIQFLPAPPAQALGRGRVCVFYFPFGHGLVGHTAWAFSVPGSNQWVYGSADHDQGGNYPHGFDIAPITNGVWVLRTGNGFDDVLSTFRARAYTAYTCKDTPTSVVGRAQDKAFADREWTLFGNNCATHTDDILSTYYGGTFTVHYAANGDPAPLDWFNSLPGRGGQGFDAVQPLFAPAGFKGGTVKTDDLGMRDAGRAGPVRSPGARRWSGGPRSERNWSSSAG